ncbi:CDP-diacylglycerol--serine O-phosphatidyltransferase, partial [Pseudomonas syringae]|nr:CDP-diacylglycerol--serine O-phosphatidyltransferase [Pseudomonas syringae]
GASLNDVYLHRHEKYRYDRYQLLSNAPLADAMIDFMKKSILTAAAVQRLDREDRPKSIEIKNETRQFRQNLRSSGYHFKDCAGNDELAVTPIVGLGKQNELNRT